MSVLSRRRPRGGRSVRRWLPPVAAGLAVLAVCAPLRTPRLPHGTDTLFHLYTLVQLDWLVDAGHLWSRWFPHQASGFGLPLFQFYPPLSSYIALLFTRLGAEPVTAIRCLMALGFVAAAAGMYGWARTRLSPASSAVAAAAYAASPYVLYNAYARGGLAEHAALAVIPWLFWALAATARRPSGRRIAAVGASCGLLIVAHLLTAAAILPAAAGYVVVLVARRTGREARRKILLALAAGLGLGLALAAFYWLPAVAERGAIADTLARTPDLDFRRNFLPASRLVAPPLPVPPRAALHPLALLLAGAAVVATLQALRAGDASRDRRHPPLAPLELGIGLLTVTSACLMATSPSLPAWELLPPLRFFQFPQRFLAAALPWTALLAGAGVTALTRALGGRQPVRLVAVVAVVVALVPAAGLSAMRHYPALPPVDVAFIMDKERASAQIGTLYIGSFMPVEVQRLPSRDRLSADGPRRLRRDLLPTGAVLHKEVWSPLRYELDVELPAAAGLHFETFWFPGWEARVNGERAALGAEPPFGTLALEVPAGRHRVEVSFGSTPLRRTAGTTSFAALLALVGMTWWPLRRRV